MDIKNIALVRATNVIPFDGVVHPISETPYLKKEKGTTFAYAINDLLRKLSKISLEGYWTKTEEEQQEMDRQNKEVLEQYLPYNSDYNSMVLWALNGLVPDDMNNTFSNKTCAIIESLEEQIDKSEIVSLVPTDTAIKGNVRLSNKATILISKDRYEALSEHEKEQLKKLDLKVHIFEGTLQENVNATLENSGTFTAEQLSLTRADKGYMESDTKEELIETIKDIAESYNIAQVLHWNVLTGQNDELDKLETVQDEYKNNITVMQCYQKSFFQYLFSKMAIDKRVSSNVLGYMESSVYMEELCNEIERIGIDEYKKIVDEYNSALEKLRKQGTLPTPEQIVGFTKENKDFNLIPLIQQVEKDNIEEHKDDNEMKEYLTKLQEKYGYNEELTETLGKIIPAFIAHFGQEYEQLVLDAIESCEIHIKAKNEDTTEYLKKFFPGSEEEKIPGQVGAFYKSEPVEEDNTISSKRLIYVKSDDFKNEKLLSTLVHEMGHLIKSYNNEYTIVNGKIVQRVGISTCDIDKDEETGKYSNGKETYIGIEEAINCYDEEKIMNILLGKEFTDVCYTYHFNEAFNPLFENKELMMAFRSAQLNGTDAHIQFMERENFEKIAEWCEKMYRSFVATPREVLNKDRRNALIQGRDEGKQAIIDYANEDKKKRTEAILKSGIEATERNTRTGKISDATKTIKRIQLENTQKTQESIKTGEEIS